MRITSKRKPTRKPAFAALTVFAIATVALALWLPERSDGSDVLASAALAETATAAALPVRVVNVAMQPGYTVAERYAGRVVARRESKLGFERSARLAEVRVDQGARVEAGDVLAVLETDALLAREVELGAQVEQIRAHLALARLTTGRKHRLAKADTVSTQELDEAHYQEQAVAAELAAAEAGLARVRVDLAQSVLEAPFSGSITQRFVDEGTVLAPGERVLELIEDTALEVEIGVPPGLAAGLASGSRHTVEVNGAKLGATLQTVVAKLRVDTRTVRVVFRLDPLASGVNSGALARITFDRDVESAGAWLPISALAASHRGLWSVYALAPDEAGPGLFRVDRREVEVLHAEADRVFVRGTLRDGEPVVATGLHRLVPGLLVRRASEPSAELAHAS